MKRVVLSGVLLCLIFAMLAGCGGKKSSSTTTTVTVTLSPTAASVSTGQTQQFTATVANTTNTAVNWTVNGLAGGNQTVGFVSTTGLYTAPNSVPTPATVTVAAISQADTAATGSATVTVTAPATPSAALVVSPQSVTVPAGAQQTFSATVSGSAIAVNWTLNCQSAAAGACGTIDANGVYTAPAAPPPGATVTVTAAAKDNSVPASAAVVTVQFSNGTLKGQYAFTVAGSKASSAYAAEGSITFDGNGNITGGIVDVNTPGGLALNVSISGGSYHVGNDGHGNATVQLPSQTLTLRLVAVNHSRALVMIFDASAAVSASGTMDLQDATQFTNTAFSGAYAFQFSETNPSPFLVAEAGALQADGAGNITGGKVDASVNGTVTTDQAISGNYSPPDASGHGNIILQTGPIGTESIQYSIVDATHLKLMWGPSMVPMIGDLYKQPAGPFSSTNLRGAVAFALLGMRGTTPLGLGGVIILNGAGTVTSGSMDINDNGNNPQNAPSVTGTYSVTDAATGRTTMTLNAFGSTLQFAVYPQINGALSMVEIGNTNDVLGGRAVAQSVSSFSGGSLLGNCALSLTGNDLVVIPGGEDLLGTVVANGGSVITGSVDISNKGTLVNSAALTASYQVSSNGRGTATITSGPSVFPTGTLAIYVVDSNNALFLESDSTRVLAGALQKQF